MGKSYFTPKSSTSHQQEGEITTPYSKAKEYYDRINGEERRARRQWQIVAFVMMGLCLILIFGLIWAISLAKTVPFVIALTPWGEAQSYGVIGESQETIKVPENANKYTVVQFIKKMREVGLDRNIMAKNYSDLYKYITTKSETLLTEKLTEANPMQNIGKYRIEVTIQTVMKVSGVENARQVDWIETVYAVDGSGATKKYYRGMFSLYYDSSSYVDNYENPLGIYIDSFDIQEIKAF